MWPSILITVVGGFVFLIGLAKISANRSGGLKVPDLIQKNFGVNFGGTQTQTIKGAGAPSDATRPTGTDWSGVITASIGLIAATIGLASALIEHSK
jgi:hypothetical protein